VVTGAFSASYSHPRSTRAFKALPWPHPPRISQGGLSTQIVPASHGGVSGCTASPCMAQRPFASAQFHSASCPETSGDPASHWPPKPPARISQLAGGESRAEASAAASPRTCVLLPSHLLARTIPGSLRGPSGANERPPPKVPSFGRTCIDLLSLPAGRSPSSARVSLRTASSTARATVTPSSAACDQGVLTEPDLHANFDNRAHPPPEGWLPRRG
jgi:hypothetical protein